MTRGRKDCVIFGIVHCSILLLLLMMMVVIITTITLILQATAKMNIPSCSLLLGDLSAPLYSVFPTRIIVSYLAYLI